ncbi:MAG: T9SS type A sorting domain-containing protein, partial [candidate division Zixibacteria bacterium]|nr:T9SS type A sorting domain-containing protein [candidate division Zixibacteria bacterium]
YKYDPVSGWHRIWLCDEGGFATTYSFLLDVDNDGECEIVLSGELLRVRVYDRQLGGIVSDENGTKDDDLILYPNPTNNTLKISLSKFTPIGYLDIFDSNGRLVKKINLKNVNSVNWDLCDNQGKEVASGIYFIVYDISGVQKVKRATILH